MLTKPGGARLGIEIPQTFILHPVAGAVATDGIQYSAAKTFSEVAAVEIFNQLIDPGYSMGLKELEVGLTQKFENFNGSYVGTIIYHWDARQEYTNPVGTAGPNIVTGAWIPIHGTLSKGIGTLLTSEDTLSGYIPVGSIPHAPVRLRLRAKALQPSASGKIKNSSYIRMVGNVIPGT